MVRGRQTFALESKLPRSEVTEYRDLTGHDSFADERYQSPKQNTRNLPSRVIE